MDPRPTFIAAGSNIKPEIYIPRAIAEIETIGKVLAVSAAYRNPAVGASPAPEFVNAALLLETGFWPLVLRQRLRDIEDRLGRVRGVDRCAPRTIDLDLVMFGDLVLLAGDMALPDPEILERSYLARPLADLAPDFVHPVSNEPLFEVAERLDGEHSMSECLDVDLSRWPCGPIRL